MDQAISALEALQISRNAALNQETSVLLDPSTRRVYLALQARIVRARQKDHRHVQQLLVTSAPRVLYPQPAAHALQASTVLEELLIRPLAK